jgi:hypothetical protein
MGSKRPKDSVISKAFSNQNNNVVSRQESTQPLTGLNSDLIPKKKSVSSSKAFFDRRNQSNTMRPKINAKDEVGPLNSTKPGSRLKKDANELSHKNIFS